MIRIHNFRRGARGVRAGWVCEEMGLPYEFVAVDYPPSASYVALNPLRSVPLLEDGTVRLSESIAIMLYLAETHGPTPLLRKTDKPAFATILELTIFGEASMGACLNPLMAARFAAPGEAKRNWSVEMLEARFARLLDHVSGRLGEHAWFVGTELSLADISIETALQMWQGALGGSVPANLAAWRERLKTRPAYQRAMAAQA
jgi:glutathione S-transferase